MIHSVPLLLTEAQPVQYNCMRRATASHGRWPLLTPEYRVSSGQLQNSQNPTTHPNINQKTHRGPAGDQQNCQQTDRPADRQGREARSWQWQLQVGVKFTDHTAPNTTETTTNINPTGRQQPAKGGDHAQHQPAAGPTHTPLQPSCWATGSGWGNS